MRDIRCIKRGHGDACLLDSMGSEVKPNNKQQSKE